MKYDEKIIEKLENEIIAYTNPRNRLIANYDVELFNDGALSEGEASGIISQVHRKLNALKENLIDLKWAEEGDKDLALEWVKNSFEDVYSFTKENLSVPAFNNLKEDIFNVIKQNILTTDLSASKKIMSTFTEEELDIIAEYYAESGDDIKLDEIKDDLKEETLDEVVNEEVANKIFDKYLDLKENN